MSGTVLHSEGVAPAEKEQGWIAAIEVDEAPKPQMSYIANESGHIGGLRPVWQSVAVVVAAAALFVACSFQMGLQSVLAGKFYPGVSIAGQDLGGKTYRQGLASVRKMDANRTVTVSAAGKDHKVSLAQLGTTYNVSASLDKAYAVGRSQWWGLAGLGEARTAGKTGYVFAVDRATLNSTVAGIVSASGQAPVDAKVVVENGVPRIENDKDGVAVDAEVLTKRLEQAIAQADLAPLAIEPTVQEAKIQAAALPSVVEKTKTLLSTPIKLTAENKTFSPNAKEVGEWFIFEAATEGGVHTLTPKLDEGKVKGYVQLVASKVNVAAVNKEINIQNGETKSEKAGADGKAIDQDAVVSQLKEAVMSQRSLAYAMPMKPVAFKTVYNRSTVLDAARYIEINLSMQRLWVYENQQVVYQTPITSGASNYGFGTSVGMFAIYYKTTNTHLRGNQYGPNYNYDVQVDYWMPFNGGEGLHDASWRSAFGGQDYKYSGSHGCVNLPDPAAAWVYNWATIGTPVWVHY